MTKEESEKFLERAFTHYPEWRSYLTRYPPNLPNYYYLIQFPSPVKGRSMDLFWLHLNGPAYAFSGWHEHYLDVCPAFPEKREEAFWKQIDDIMNDKLIVVNFLGKNGSTWTLTENSNLCLTVSDLPEKARSYSWSGRFDFNRP